MSNRALHLFFVTFNVFVIARGPIFYVPVAMALLYVALLSAFEADE